MLSDAELDFELLHMTDRYTDELFDDLPGVAVTFPISRLVVDVQRFEDDNLEPISSRRMGALYRQTHDQRPLRRTLSVEECGFLLDQFYRPHHQVSSA
jgi:N-formylglutamate deformylase